MGPPPPAGCPRGKRRHRQLHDNSDAERRGRSRRPKPGAYPRTAVASFNLNTAGYMIVGLFLAVWALARWYGACGARDRAPTRSPPWRRWSTLSMSVSCLGSRRASRWRRPERSGRTRFRAMTPIPLGTNERREPWTLEHVDDCLCHLVGGPRFRTPGMSFTPVVISVLITAGGDDRDLDAGAVAARTPRSRSSRAGRTSMRSRWRRRARDPAWQPEATFTM